MKNKFSKVGLDYNLINNKFTNMNEYEKTVCTYFEDPFFVDLKKYIDDEDYALAKDACKGLFCLAQDLLLVPLYAKLIDIYEDLEYEDYKDIAKKYDEMYKIYLEIRGIFYV